MIAEDGKCQGKDTLSALYKLVDIDQIDMITGLVCTTEVMAIKPIIEEKQILTTPSAVAPSVTSGSQYIFRLTSSSIHQIQRLLQYLAKNNLTRIAILQGGTDVTSDLSNYTKQKAGEMNLQIIIEEIFSDNSSDFKSQILKIKESQPQAILLYPQGYSAPMIILRQIREMDWATSVLGEETLMSAILVNNYPLISEGVTVSGIIATFDKQSSQNQKYQEFKTKFNQKFGKDPIYTYYQAVSYDTIHLINQALQAGFRTSDELKNYFENLPEYYGASGRVELDNHERVLDIDDVSLLRVENGEFVPIN